MAKLVTACPSRPCTRRRRPREGDHGQVPTRIRCAGDAAAARTDSTRMTFASAREATRSFATLTLAPWVARVEAAFQATVLGPQYRLRFDIGSLTKADVESHFAALLRGRQGGWLSPNDCRLETGWPAVPGGDDISPPNTSAAAAGDDKADDGATSDPAAKIIDLGRRHAGD